MRPGHCLTDAWAARYRQLGTEILLYAMEFGCELAAAKVEIEGTVSCGRRARRANGWR
jgi:hypothetical protein